MNLTNVKLILAREVRDQLRDRRTLFMIFVLPVLLYPLLGTAYFEMVQFQTKKPMTVLVVGGRQLANSPVPLIVGDTISPVLFPDGPAGADLLRLELAEEQSPGTRSPAEFAAAVEHMVQEKEIDAAVIFPPDFAKRLEAYRKAIQDETARPRGSGASSAGSSRNSKEKPPEGGTPAAAPEIPQPKIIYTAANERSLTAFSRLTVVLERWTEELGKTNLVAGGLPAEAVRPFEIGNANLAGPATTKSTNIWSRLLPVLMLLWAMTGAFYPAIDLCAGEKERGTLETLLSSPAERTDIVLGKLLTIMVFSMATAALNLIGGGITGELIFRQMAGFGGPPLLAVVWLALALVPVSALFSALCLALASFARSTKEGQYYLMPLLMFVLPLAILPIVPGVELNVGLALVPVSGLVLLLKTLLEGSYREALLYLPAVLAVTLGACWLSIRWAIEQFNAESVLFRESERFDMSLWLKSLFRDREPLPSPAEGLFCGVLILVLGFIFGTFVSEPPGFAGFARIVFAKQLAVVLIPSLLMAAMLTSSPRRTLLLTLPRWQMLPAAALLAVALHPFIVAMGSLVVRLYPIAPNVQAKLASMQDLFSSANLGMALLVVAVLPAVCEEAAFRGFILSGCRSRGNNGRAIILSAIFFGIAHGMLQQQINTLVVGLVLGFLAVRSGSLLPGMLFHVLHNSMTFLASRVSPEIGERFPGLGFFVHSSDQGMSYRWPAYVVGGIVSLVVAGWLVRFSAARSEAGATEGAIHAAKDDEARLLPANEVGQ